MAEPSNNPVDALIGLIRSQLVDVNTCLPGTIVSYAGGLARVLPTGSKRFADGDILEFPIIPNVRVCWPSFAGGSAGVKGPVLPGDKCLLIFSQQAVDGSDDRRMFDLQDAYAVMCDLGSTGAAPDNASMSMFFGGAFIKLTQGGQLVINAPAGVAIDTHGVGTVVNGNFAQSGGNLSSNGVTLATHVHGGVQPGGSNTGTPV